MLTEGMIFRKTGSELALEKIDLQEPGPHELLIQINACAVCRTDLHVVDGDLKNPKLPLVPGHEVVGRVLACGSEVESIFKTGDRVCVPWLASCCFKCQFCKSGQENLCESPEFTGYTKNGGFAGHMISDSRFTFKLSDSFAAYKDEEVAPLLCAGLIGWRSFKFACRGNYEAGGRRLGIYGFGAAGHLVLQIASFFNWQTYAFTREGDRQGQEFAQGLGAFWAGSSKEMPPEKLDAAIIFAPVGSLVPAALQALKKGGLVVCGGIHMSDIPQFSYALLWGERSIVSVANLTRQDANEFLELAPRAEIKARISRYKLKQANEALSDLRDGRVEGAAVLCLKAD